MKKDIQIFQLISKNGEEILNEKRTNVCLFMPRYFLDLINTFVKERIGMNRNTWILEAIQEKMERDHEKISD